MKHRDSVRRTAGSGDSRWWTAFKLAAVVAVGALAVGWGITVDENQRGAYTFRLPESRSGKWISSLPLEVAEAPPVLNTTEPGVELGKDRIQAGSYPAVTLGPALDGVEAQRLDSLMLTQYPPEIDTTTYTRWWEAGPHPYLDSILPGARYLVVRWYQPVTRYGNMTRPGYRSTYVLFNGLLFPVEKLAHLLVAAGFDLDSADAPIAARVAVLLWAFEKATSVRSDIAYCFFDLPSGRESDTTSAVIPSIEFRSLDWGEWWNAESTSVFGGIWVDCTIGGTPRRIFVRFQEFGSRGQIEPIWLFDGAGSIRFDGIWPFPPPNDDGNPQGRILRDGDWTLQVSGDVWTEQEGGSGKVHHFLLADSNGTPTHHKYIFTVTGVSTQQAFLVFDCQQGKDTFSLKASVNGQVATLEWEPGYDSTAEYVVWASPDSNGSRESNIEVIDPEAWLFEQVDPAGKYVKLRYMKSNDRDGSLDARETADTLFAGIRAAWDVYVPLMGGCYPLSHPQAGDDTLEVILADTMLGWYHYKRPDAEQTGYPYPPRFVGENVPRPCGWYIWVPCDWDLQQQGYIETRNGLKTTAAHELWHACQLPLRAYWPGSEMMMWIEEGMATAVPTIVFDHELLQAGGRNTQYRSRVSDYLGDGLGCFPYDNPGNPYGFAAFWRHLYEHDSGSPAILVKVCEKLDSVWGGWSLDSVMRTARRRIDCALAANGSQPYANFDAALSGFHCYCCLTQYSGWWTAGGPGGFYPPLSCDDDYAYDGKVHAMPTRTTDAQTGYAYLFTKSGAPSGDVYLTFDGDPDKRGQGLFPSFEVSAVRIDGGQVSFQPFALDQVKNRGVVSFPNADWDTIFVCVTNCDADPNSDGKHKLVLSPQPENVGTQPSGQDNDDWLIIRPRNRGQDPDGPVHFLRPSVWVYNRGATLDSFEVCCSITQDGVPAYFDRDSLYVAPGESTYLRFDSVFDYSSGEYDSVYQMLLYTDLENDMDRSNDTTTRQLSIKDTTLVNRWIPDLPFPTWQHDSCYYGYEPYDELDPEHLLKDGNRTRHRSKQASCWHLRDGADGFPWDENQTKYMCLRWHGGKLAGDTFWTPYFSCVGGGNVRVRFRHHLVRRPYPDDPFVATIMGATDGSSHKPDVELFRFETGGPGADTLEGDTTVNMLWAKDPGRDNSDRNHTYLKLCYVGDSTGIRDWCVDDLRILPESIPARDVAAQEVLWPGKWTQLVAGEELLPVVKVCNYGDCAETCDVYLRVKRGETVVYDDSIPSVSVPLRSKVWVELPARTVDWSEGDNYYAESWVASPEDECPGNDTTRRYGISVLPPGFAWVANNPFGKVKQGSDLTSDGEFIYVKNVKKETVCRYHPGFRCWDTIQKLRPLSQWEKMNSKSGGLVCVDTANELYVHWRKDGSAPIAPIARLRLDRPAGNEKWDLVWPDSASIDLRLTTAMVWDGNDTIFALNRSDGSSNSIHSLAAFSLSGKRWTTVATLPCKVKVDGGLCIKDRILYLAGLKDMGYLYRLDLNDDRQWHQAGLIPGNRAKVASLEVVGGHIYLLRGGRLETDGMYRYDTDSCVWSSMLEHSPWKIQPGACMTAHGSNLYVFPGKKTQDFYRYVIPQDEKFWREVPASAPVLPTQCLTPGVLYGEPRLLGGTDPGGGQEVLVDTGDFEALSPRWSPDGAWLAYLREDDGGTMQVYRCPAEGGPAQPVTDDGFDKEDLDWSPDGQWVVFQFTDEDGYCRIGKIRADGSEYSVLTPGFKDSECPRWSPDGSLITYQQTDQYSHTQVWSMDSSGTNHSQLTYGDLDHDQPVPGSDHVYYEREANGWTQIYRVGYGGGGETQVTSSMNEHARPRISPDGKWLACERDDATGYTQVCVVDLDLFTEEAVTSSNCDNEWPGFTPDCEYVVFCASDGVGSQQCEVPVSGGAVEPLTTVSDECYAPACSPNGKWVAYSKEDSTLSEVGLFKTRRFLGDSITVFLLDDSVVDVTRDSLRVDFSIEGDAWVVLRVKKGGTAVRTLIDSVWMEAGDYTYHWNGKKSDGKLALPGADYVVRIDAHGDTGWPGYDQKSLRVKGTLVPATIGVSSTWTTTNDPYVITGHNLEFSGAGNLNLTVNHGVRVMFTQDATRHGIIVGNGERIVAGGTQQDSVYFMPHRKMADQFNPQGRGWWSGIHFNYDSRGADFDYSVFENGGGGTDAAVLYVQTPVAGTLVDLDHCRLRGSAGKGIAVYTETAGERVDFDYSVFSHCADYPVYEVKAPAVAGVVATCSFVNNDINGLAVHSGGVDEVISTSCTWPCCGPGWHYDPDEDLEIWSATGYPVLTLGAGATIRMQAGKVIRVGYAEGLTMRRGALKAVGTPGEFISFEGDGGDEWSGLWVNYDPGDSTSFRYCVFRDGTGQSRDIQDGIDYHPMLYLDETSSEVSRCKFLEAWRSAGDERGVGLFVRKGHPYIQECKFLDNECGLLADLRDETSSCTTEYCQFDGNYLGCYVTDLDADAPARLRYCNLWDNSAPAVDDDDSPYFDARNNWWGPYGSGDNRGKPYEGGNDGYTGNVLWSPWSTTEFAIWAHDAGAVSIAHPTGWELPGVLVPRALARNYLDEPVTVVARMKIGSVYEDSVEAVLAGSATDTVFFPPALLDSGYYQVSFKVRLDGDENPGNDSVGTTVWVRDSVNAAAVAVTAPADTVTIEDTIAPAVRIANLGPGTTNVPVVFWLDSVVVETVYAEVAPLETTEVCFTERGFGKGGHELRFACCLALDDDRSNDTVATSVYVKTGDFWVAESAPPLDQARLCWAGGYIYAADRASAAVHRYDIGDGDWSAVAEPPVSGVYGITALDGQVYLLGSPGSDGGGSSGGLRAAGAVRARAGRDALAGFGTEAGFSAGPQLLRYEPAGDTWELVTECDSTVVLGSATALVADRSTALYLVEGGSDRILRYDVEADSWAEPPRAPGVINRWGAAGWAGGVLYCLAGPRTLLAYSPGGDPEWRWVKLPDDNPENTCGTALGCDPVLDRAFLFYPSVLSSQPIREPFGALPRVLWELNRGETWNRRAELASEATGAALSFASTQAYCLDGDGGFWRYRPQPVLDAASVAILAPDAVARESTFTPMGVVQNSREDSLQFQVRLETEGYSDVQQVTVPPQSWDTVAFMPWSFPLDLPEPYEFTMTALLGDARPYNDTVTDTVWVRYRKDAAAAGVNSPCGQVPYDSVVQPVGVVWNRCDEELSAWVIMTIDSCYADSVLRVLAPHAWVEVDSFATFTGLPLGPHEVKLRVRVEGDENPANDQCFGWFEVVNGGYWRRLAMTRQSEVVLAGGAGGEVLAADRWSMSASRYLAVGDTWVNAEQSPFEQHYSASRSGAGVYVLGRSWSEPEGGIARYDVDSASWSMVTESLPRFLPPSGAGCLLATGPDTLFLLVDDPDTNLFRYDVALDSWYPLARLPVPVYEFTAGAWDGGDNLYVMGNNNAQLWRYSIAADSWEQRQGLWRSWPMGAALCCDRDRGLLYALWADLGSDLHQYDVGDDVWTWLPSYPGSLTRPALVFQDGKAYAHGGGQMFWEYLPKPATDIAAQAILSPPDTVRFDEMFLPVGVVENLSEDPAWCDVSFCIGTNVQFRQVYLAPEQVDTAYFDSTMAEAGHHTAVLQVMCQGDDNPANDVCEKSVVVSAPWAQRNPPPFFAGRLDADSGATVFAADRHSMTAAGYDVEGDTWSELVPTPFPWGTYDLSYHENRVYALGDDGVTDARVGGDDAAPPVTDDSDPWAIYRYDLGDTVWDLVTDSMPEPVCPYSWLTATGQGIYLLPGMGTGFYRHDSSAGWQAMAPVPAWVEPNCALDWDRHDAIYLLTHNPDSSRFFRYSIAGDSWAERPALPVEAWPGLVLAADPDTGTVLALNGPMFFEFDRQTETWSLRDGPPWSATDGAALCFAGPFAYALTGQPCTPSWFWCFDPAFEYGDRGSKDADGVAGAPGGLTNRLNRCTPNPLSRQTAISYQFVREGHVRLQVHDITGRRVRLLQNGRQTPGVYTVRWDGRDDRGNEVANGIYFYHLATPGFEDVKKAVVMR